MLFLKISINLQSVKVNFLQMVHIKRLPGIVEIMLFELPEGY